MKTLRLIAAVLAISGICQVAFAQHSHDDREGVKLHVNPRWSECSFQLDGSLTQDAFREFTKEAGLVIYFRPLIDAKPMGAGKFEVALLNWKTAFDDTKPAWNDTFVHPDSTHWLKESPRLAIPGLTFRAGITDKLDVGVYITKSPGANYGFYGAQLQYNLLNNTQNRMSLSARASFVNMYGPEDLNVTAYGADVIASKEFLIKEKFSVAPYAIVSSHLNSAREKSQVVDLENENVFGLQAAVGTTVRLAFARAGIEYNIGNLSTISFKIGAAF